MNAAASILLPMVAMAALTVIVWVRLYMERIGEMYARRIHPQKLTSQAQVQATLQHTQAADNFRNLFELPVLFYALCLALAAAGAVSPLFVTGAWTYVGLRAAHSFIHVTYNRVLHRFWAYAASSVLLFVLWGIFGLRLLMRD